MLDVHRHFRAAAVGLSLLTPACDSMPHHPSEPSLSPAAVSPIAASRAPVEVPLFEQFDDLNPCTGAVVTITFTGTARIHQFGNHSMLVANGSVATSDGFTGSFNRQIVVHGDRVTHARFHDMEVNQATGQRIIFGVGMFHETTAGGEIRVSFVHFSGAKCVGPAA